MTTHKRARDQDAYRELPFLLKPLQTPTAKAGRAASAPAAMDVSTDSPPPPSAGYNPYFDLPPDTKRPARSSAEGERR